jgi:prepilin peptidase CpaA
MVIVWVLFGFVAVCFYTDMVERKIYNAVILCGLVVAFILNGLQQGLYLGTTNTLAGFFTGIFLLIIPFILGGLGAGDVKMLGMIGAFVGHAVVVEVLLASAIVGGIYAFLVMLKQGRMLKRLKIVFIGIFCSIGTRKSLHLNTLDDHESQKHAIPYGAALSTGVIIIYIMGSLNYMLPAFAAAGF